MLKLIITKIRENRLLSPYQTVVFSFMAVIIVGAVVLMLPVSASLGESISFTDALFTATSAVCVNGLTVVNISQKFSAFGQTVLIILVQIGGLGVMTITLWLAVLAGRQMRLGNRLLVQESLNLLTFSGVKRLLVNIGTETFVIEFIGGTIMAVQFYQEFGLRGIYLGYWHAISAFCNAGFDILGSSGIAAYITAPSVGLTLSILTIFGSLGFKTLEELKDRFIYKKYFRFSLNTKIVLSMTALLLIVGTVMLFLLEYSNNSTIGGLSMINKSLASFYLSVISRSSGFALINTPDLGNAALFLIMILMFIGGAPGSTAGGIKTTTFAVIVSSTFDVIRGREDVEIFKRRIDSDTIMRALALFFISSAIVVAATMYLFITEQFTFVETLFEVISAFATVGLTTGITPLLSNSGKLLIICIMFVGRVGVATFTLSLAMQHKKVYVHHPSEKVSIG